MFSNKIMSGKLFAAFTFDHPQNLVKYNPLKHSKMVSKIKHREVANYYFGAFTFDHPGNLGKYNPLYLSKMVFKIKCCVERRTRSGRRSRNPIFIS